MAKKETTILTKNVNKGVAGTRINKVKYETFRKAILAVVPKNKAGILFKDMPKLVARKIPKEMLPAKGSASWYTTVVKLDLEARKLIERIPGETPQRVRRVG